MQNVLSILANIATIAIPLLTGGVWITRKWRARKRLNITPYFEERGTINYFLLTEDVRWRDNKHQYLLINVSNPSGQPITVVSLHFVLPNQKEFQVTRGSWTGTSLPAQLANTEQWELCFEPLPLAKAIQVQGFVGKIELRVRLRDTTSKSYTSRPLFFDSDYWLVRHR